MSYCRFVCMSPFHIFLFFFNDTATTEIYTLSLHDALPILIKMMLVMVSVAAISKTFGLLRFLLRLSFPNVLDRKSGSAGMPRPISYAVFCLKKKKNIHVLYRSDRLA